MSLRHSHTLIPTSPQFLPSAAEVQAFLTSMLQHGVIGDIDRQIKLRTPSERVRTFLD